MNRLVFMDIVFMKFFFQRDMGAGVLWVDYSNDAAS
jgi:hypothetical protein